MNKPNLHAIKGLLSIIVGIIFSSQTNCAYAAQAFIGVSWNWGLLKGEEQTTGFDVAEITSEKDLGLVLSVKSMDSYFTNSSFGYYIEFGMDSYAFNRNVLSGSGEVNTRLEGRYWHLTPTVFYDFFKRSPGDWSIKIGAGLGIGYITADGLVMIEGPGLPIKAIDGNDFDTSIGIILKFTYKHWVFLAKEYTPSAKIDGVDFKIELPTFIVGYRFDF